MSAIIEKVFNWAHKIDRAIFKGAPSLITATDLNRQIELLKKEIFITQQSVGPVSDTTMVVVVAGSTIQNVTISTAEGRYLYFKGVRYVLPTTITGVTGVLPLGLDPLKRYRINLYAAKKTVAEVDDSTKTISGAKFVDDTVLPAADHIVFETEELIFEEYTNNFFTNLERTVGGKEFICTLYEVYWVVGTPVQTNFCVPFGQSIQSRMMSTFSGVKVPTLTFPNLEVGATINETLRTLMDRLYTLERRLFLENSLSYMDPSKPALHTFAGTANGLTVSGEYLVSGNFCTVAGQIVVATSLLSARDVTISTNLPRAALKAPLMIQGRVYGLLYNIGENSATTAFWGSLGNLVNEAQSVVFKGNINAGTFDFSIVYPIEIAFWERSSADTQPLFPVNQ